MIDQEKKQEILKEVQEILKPDHLHNLGDLITIKFKNKVLRQSFEVLAYYKKHDTLTPYLKELTNV